MGAAAGFLPAQREKGPGQRNSGKGRVIQSMEQWSRMKDQLEIFSMAVEGLPWLLTVLAVLPASVPLAHCSPMM